jgi:hypothetical protein
MERESPVEPSHLTGIHINLEDQAIEFEDRHGTIGRLVFGQEVVLYEGQPLLLTPTREPHGDAASAAQPPHPNQQRRRHAAPQSSHNPPPPNRGEQV